uniref:Uncharacterized protein n=1 Tax=Romanomermis culicivorax TaxID=13658 RepID=A0A915L230_ROMCU
MLKALTGLTGHFTTADIEAVLMQQLPYKATSWGPEWQMDQTAGENIMNRPGGSLFINPVRGDDIYVSEYTQTGMFFCASVDPEKEGDRCYIGKLPNFAVRGTLDDHITEFIICFL